MYKKILFALLALIGVLLLIFFLQKPSHNRNWEIQSKTLPEISLDGDTVTITNIRDFTYSPTDITDLGYTTRTFNINNVTKAYFIIEPFSAWDAVGHTFLSFDIEGQDPIAFSVEARREEDESYSALAGLFKKYELWYVWGNETDLIVRRGLYLDHPLYMYELELEQSRVQKLITGLIQKTVDLQDNPKFYNTLLSNCTNELAKIANSVTPDSIPFHYSLFLTGYSDEYLYQLGLIENTTLFKELESQHYITNIVKEIYSEEDFSTTLRNRVFNQ